MGATNPLQGKGAQVAMDRDNAMPIAIVGLSCRLPGGVKSPQDLWQICAEQRDVWQAIPQERFNMGILYHPDPSRNGTSNVRGGYFLDDDPGLFDAAFFNLTAGEARAMDPQQRLLLELSYEALENAGITLEKISKTDTAVFVGSSCRDYADLLQRDPEKAELFQSTGTGQTMLSNRLSYFYDLTGPSASVDTACSSSLVALHLACNALRLGESRMAIVGGSNLILSHDPMLALSMLRFLSPDGRCYTYDARANGFGRGEGASCLIIKPLAAALEDGDTIRAVIRNTGTNQDGRTVGITLPSGDAQIELIDRTYRNAGLDPSHTEYVECHGTGTAAGDPIEAASLAKVFGRAQPLDRPLKVGSIKSNIGHLEGGSGIAGVVKTVMMLENSLILPNFDFQKANPRIPMHDWRLDVPKTLQSWPTQDGHRASVNNFGFGGSNAHAIIDDARSYLLSKGLNGNTQRQTTESRRMNGLVNGVTGREDTGRSRVFVLSASNECSGRQQVKALRQYLDSQQYRHGGNPLDDLAFTLGEHRSVLPCKAAFSATSVQQALNLLTDDNIKFLKLRKARNLGFVFTGQGAQWLGMGTQLIHLYPTFHQSLTRADTYLKALGAPWSLLDELCRDAKSSSLQTALLSQPLTTAIQIALVDLLASWGIRPLRVTGHSSGEIAAAYSAGALTQQSALSVAYHRGVVAQKIKTLRNGAMVAVGLSEEEVKPWIAKLKQGKVKVACINSAENVTISGDHASVLELFSSLQEEGVFARELAVDVAYHSHHMEDMAMEYLKALDSISCRNSGSIEFHSSVTGKRINLSELNAEYWASNMVNSVRFLDSMQSLLLSTSKNTTKSRGLATAVDVLIEIGPHPALQTPVKQILQGKQIPNASRVQYMATLSRHRNAVETCHNLVCNLFVHGYPVNLSAVNRPAGPGGARLLVDMAPYGWDHSAAYWAESCVDHSRSLRDLRDTTRSDILGVRTKHSNPLEPCWRNVVRVSEIPWLQDHIIQSNAVYPAAGFLAMAIEAAKQHAQTRGMIIKAYMLREISFTRALVIPQTSDNVETMVSLRQHSQSIRVPSDIWDEFCISSSTDSSLWTENCRGLISVQKYEQRTEVNGTDLHRTDHENSHHMKAEFEKNCVKFVNVRDVYNALDKNGLSFGPLFANMIAARVSTDKCIANVSVPDTAAAMPGRFEYPSVVHPATLDSCIHAVFPINARHNRRDQGTPLPTYIDELFVSGEIKNVPGHVFSVYARSAEKAVGKKASNSIGEQTHSLAVFDQEQTDPQPSITIQGLSLTPLTKVDSDTPRGSWENMYYQTRWQPDPRLLTSSQTSELGRSFRLPLEELDQARTVQQVAFYYAEQALSGISSHEASNLQIHHKKFYTALTEFCTAIRGGQFGPFQTNDWLSMDSRHRKVLCDRVRQMSYGILLCHVGENLGHILRNEIDPLSLMMEDDRLEKYYRSNQSASQCYQQAAAYIKLLANKNPHINVLEIGAGTGGATLPILEMLGSKEEGTLIFGQYDFTDVSPAFLEKAALKLGRWSDNMTFQKLDIEVDPLQQGYEPSSYDLIIAANVLHATSCVERTLERVKKLLKPGGKLIMIELTVNTMAASLIFGTLPGWWVGEEASRQNGPLLSEACWDDALRAADFTGTDAVLWDMPDLQSHYSSTIISTRAVDLRRSIPPIAIVLDTENPESSSDHLKNLLSLAAVDYVVTSLSDCNPKGRTIIVLNELTRSVLRNPSPNEYDAVKRIFLESTGVLWVTCGALIESSEPDRNLVTGLARTIRAEKGDTMIVTLDLDNAVTLPSVQRAEKVFAVLMENFSGNSLGSDTVETEYAERNGVLMIPRIIEDRTMTKFVAMTTGQPILEDQPYCRDNRTLKAEIRKPGLLDSLQFVEQDSTYGPIPENFIDVEIKASGINFRDVMSAMGQIAPYPLGCECAGIVTAVGGSVQDFKPGDHMVANPPDGCFCNAIRVLPEHVRLIPPDMAFEVAAALPIAYLTAYWAVYKVARLQKGETVLIHAASGGLGQALINLCLLVKADVFATVGTIDKKNLLMTQYNIPEERIFSSRDGTFYEGVMGCTQGRGVDVVMNSLSGEALRLSWKCIAPFGRFVELGKRDFALNTRLEMRQFEKNVSFTGLDLPLDSQEVETKRIWSEIMDTFKAGSIRAPYPITTFGVSEIETALRIMQSGKHMGKLVLVPQPNEKVNVVPLKSKRKLLREDASYLLIGGLGGIGRAIAFWMVKQGAKHLIFASPSGSEKPRAKETIALLGEQGTRVTVFKCDVSNGIDLERVLGQSKTNMPSIRGVIHAAMVPKADLFANLTLSDYNSIMRPKVDGIWHLHHAFCDPDSLDFFIMLSSIVGVSGNPSQAAYTAASVFLDAFADYRSRKDLPAVTLDLGRVVDIGIVADSISARRGVRDLWSRDIREDEVMAMIESAIITPLRQGQSASSLSGLKPWAPEADPVYQTPLFSHFRRAAMERGLRQGDKQTGSGSSAGFRERLRQASSLQDAVQKVCTGLMAKTASLLMIPLEDISAEKSLAGYGMDSLVAVEMRNWLLRELDATLPILELLENTPLIMLSEKIVRRSKLAGAILESEVA